MNEYIIEKQTGMAFPLKKGDLISIIDIEGKQVADFFAVNATDYREYFSAEATIDCKESLLITKDDILYTNLYRPMFTMIQDDVGVHDVMIPCCRKEMYDHFFHNGDGHINCFDNINQSLSEFGVPPFTTLRPLNVFMNTSITSEKKIVIDPPLSKPGDQVVLRAEMDAIVCISACSVSEGPCNGWKCKPIKVVITSSR
ncbi:DUF1989 domain-containing protein [Paenibacillus arenosi]|uniref:Urea carboxylase-associated family protein n=1 Tax=Paenibacillus arenosi TaxID=2774142 RepID=A0ABR9AV23_9BACL|nr:urea carboxylase-associated family protein [Paenibacillus arenosi]MBD8497965.1 urea carboxylase-associated family protein [Paenibacillus arenosi]